MTGRLLQSLALQARGRTRLRCKVLLVSPLLQRWMRRCEPGRARQRRRRAGEGRRAWPARPRRACARALLQGGGIPEADLDRVWSYGYTTVDDAGANSGLARPWGNYLMQLMCGSVWQSHAAACGGAESRAPRSA
jgi:hypothetical protein